MLRLPDIWDVIRVKLSKEKWTSLEEIYRIVERNSNLDDEDFEPQAPGSDIPKWKRNVRNVLQYRKRLVKLNGMAKPIIGFENCRAGTARLLLR